MNSTIFPKLPNPTSENDPNWTSFDKYLALNAITPVKHSALRSYQHAAEGRFLNAHDLNHCLTLEGARDKYASHASAEERLGSLMDFTDPNGADFEFSKAELDSLFAQHGLLFEETSEVYKGISNDAYYDYLNLRSLNVGDVIQFHGFLSTSVSRENAERFSKSGVLLVFSKINRIRTLVPPNELVLNAPNNDIPEHELLLNRQQQFTVMKITTESAISSDGKNFWVLILEAKQ